MSIAVEKSLDLLRPDRPLPLPGLEIPAGGTEVLAAWMEPRHTLLLRTLLERTEGLPRLRGSSVLLQRVGDLLDELRADTRLRFSEFRGKWTPRLEAACLLPFLQRNQWVMPHPEGGVMLAGKGTRKEAKMLYLQTLHDMASDCARQWSGVSGRWQALQSEFALHWHREVVDEDETRLLPTLEAALRTAEMDGWKSLRHSLGDMAEEAFARAVGRWEGRRFTDPESLVREAPAPWRELDPAGNGFIGFMLALSRLAEKLSLAMLDHYDRKWDLYLRGIAAAP